MSASKVYLNEKQLRAALERQGFTFKPLKNGHRILAPDGRGTAIMHRSTFRSQGGRRAYRNLLAQLERIGFDVAL